jgi:hypothetical protein
MQLEGWHIRGKIGALRILYPPEYDLILTRPAKRVFRRIVIVNIECGVIMRNRLLKKKQLERIFHPFAQRTPSG